MEDRTWEELSAVERTELMLLMRVSNLLCEMMGKPEQRLCCRETYEFIRDGGLCASEPDEERAAKDAKDCTGCGWVTGAGCSYVGDCQHGEYHTKLDHTAAWGHRKLAVILTADDLQHLRGRFSSHSDCEACSRILVELARVYDGRQS